MEWSTAGLTSVVYVDEDRAQNAMLQSLECKIDICCFGQIVKGDWCTFRSLVQHSGYAEYEVSADVRHWRLDNALAVL